MKQKDTIIKVLKHIKGYRKFLTASIILALVTVALTLYIPILVGGAIDCIADEGRVDFQKILPVLIEIGIAAGITALSQWIMNMCNNKMTYHIARDIRNEAIEKIEKLPLNYLDTHSSGDTVSRVIADVDQFTDGLLMSFTQLFTGVITILGTLGFMFSVNCIIALVVVVVTPLSLFVAKFIATKTYKLFKNQSEIRGEQTAFIEEMIENQKVVQAYTHEDENEEVFDEVNQRLCESSVKAIFFSAISNPSTRFVNNLVYAGVALTGALMAITGNITVGSLTCFLSYATQYTKPFNEISEVVTELQNALACADRVFELIEEPEEVHEKENAVVLKDVKGNIQLDNVCFSYIPEKKLIENLCLNVKSGQRIAIVGPTGCGKTTLINLLMRFYDTVSGEIYIDGNEIKDVTRKSLRQGYGMVLQETWLKAGTIKENINMGKPDATDEEIIEAAKKTHAHSFIKRLPQGYNTVIGEDGAGLSQGQKQLLCITRIMLCLPPMLILDEATSSIDTRTELKIQEAFNKLMEGRTSFIVAHRLSTVRNADILLVMKDGHIIEQGTHNELVKKGGFYSNLYYAQFAS